MEGKEVIVLSSEQGDFKIPDHAKKQVTKIETVDVYNYDQVLASIQNLSMFYDIEVIIPGFEFMVPTVAKVSEELGLRGIGAKTAEVFTNKYEMKKHLRSVGVSVSKSAMVDINTYINGKVPIGTAVAGMDFPLVVKPVDMSASIGVQKIHSHKELAAYFEEMNLEDGVIAGKGATNFVVEEYLDGPEISVEGFVAPEGDINHTSITRKLLGAEPSFHETGHIVSPSNFEKDQDAIQAYVADVVKGLGLPFGPFHAEIRLTSNKGPQLIEIAARLGGDMIADLVALAGGSSHHDLAVKSYLQMPYKVEQVKEHVAVAFLSLPSGSTVPLLENILSLDEPNVVAFFHLKDAGEIINRRGNFG